MAQSVINDKARDAIDRSLATTDYTEKRNLLGTAVFALRPDNESVITGGISFTSTIDELLRKQPDELEAAVRDAARQLWRRPS